MQEQDQTRSWYRLGWKKWLAIYLVLGGIVYAIVYFVFLRDSGGYGGGGGGGSSNTGGGGGGYALFPLPLITLQYLAGRVRQVSGWRSSR
jgi:hypothetical protein